jgi:Flp pilus assembly protein TadD
MRNFKPVIRAFLGAAAISTLVAACEEEQPPKQIATVATPAPAPSKPEVRVETPAPKPAVATAKKIEPPKTDEASASDDGTVDELLGKARDAIDKGELSRALKLARLATKKAPNKSAAFNTLGRAQLKAGARKDAIASFEKAVELNPSSSFAENNLGLALIYDGKYEEAVDALEEATQLEPVAPYMWNNLGMAYEHLDRLDDARDAYKQAVAAASDETGGAVAKENLVRLAGVKTVKPIKTAKIDSVKSDVTPVDEVPVGEHTDGGTH